MPKWFKGDEGCGDVGTQRVSHVSGRGENKDIASTGQLGEVFFKTCVTQQVQRGASVFRNKSLYKQILYISKCLASSIFVTA